MDLETEATAPVKKPVIVDKEVTHDLGPVLEGTVTAVSKSNVELTLDDGRFAVIDKSNFGLHNESPIDAVSVGDKSFGVELKREDPKGRVVLSRTWALKRNAWEKILSSIKEEKTFNAKVTAVRKKGLIVDIGLPAFLPGSHLELEPVTDFDQYVGQNIEVKVIEHDESKEKIIVSRRAQLQKLQRKETKDKISSFKQGQIVTGTVESITGYGVFVDLGGVKGLVHISELSWDRISKASKLVEVGQEIEVKILDVKVSKGRISLSMKATQPDPLKQFEVGSVIVGTVARLTDFGAFVNIGNFDGLVHNSEISEFRVGHASEILMPGEEISVKVLAVDLKKRRVELSLKQAMQYSG